LTHRKRDNAKHQDAVKQILRHKEDAIDIKKIEIGKGIL
jgi:hypothetical protein